MTDTEDLARAFEEEYQLLTGTERAVRPDDRLDELKLDSLMAQELLIALEDRFDLVVIGDPRLARVRTAGELVELMAGLPVAGEVPAS